MSQNLHVTNEDQYQLLVKFMYEHPEIFNGLVNVSKDRKIACIALWRELSEKLNAKGPPKRGIEGWKKVWYDFKYYVKTKFAKSISGDSPGKIVMFSSLEKTLIKMLNLKKEDRYDVAEPAEDQIDTLNEEDDIYDEYLDEKMPTSSNVKIEYNDEDEMNSQTSSNYSHSLNLKESCVEDVAETEMDVLKAKRNLKNRFYEKLLQNVGESKTVIEELIKHNEKIIELKQKKQDLAKKIWEDNKIYRANKLALMRQKIQIQREMLTLHQ